MLNLLQYNQYIHTEFAVECVLQLGVLWRVQRALAALAMWLGCLAGVMSLVTCLLLLSGDFGIVSVPGLGRRCAWGCRVAVFGACFDLAWRGDLPVGAVRFRMFCADFFGLPIDI